MLRRAMQVNYELRDLMQLATALTSVDRDDDGWQAVTSAKLHGAGGGKVWSMRGWAAGA